MRVGNVLWATLVAALLCAAPALAQKPSGQTRPLFRDFMGLNGHSFGFKPALYKPICRLVRDYHPLDWDLGEDTSVLPPFPVSHNGVHWDTEYGAWIKNGYDIDVSLQIEAKPQDKWKDLPRDAYAYGLAFARSFGPSGKQKLVGTAEIGNEPGAYSEAAYRAVFQNMARGLRQGDPALKIATCNMVLGKADNYSQSISGLKGLESLYDVINVHTYAFATQYPTWQRSYPEDPQLPYLNSVRQMLSWRDANAPGKDVWVTEFGWDASTQPHEPSGTFSQWVGSTDTQQAQYLVRSFLLFSALGVGHAYIYYYDDDDLPRLHSASGLTRHFVPKPSFFAVAHLYKTLGNYRFVRVIVQKTGQIYAYEYQNAQGQRVWAVWSPTSSARRTTVLLPAPPGTINRAERMPLAASASTAATWERAKDGRIRMTADESPLYLWINASGSRTLHTHISH